MSLRHVAEALDVDDLPPLEKFLLIMLADLADTIGDVSHHCDLPEITGMTRGNVVDCLTGLQQKNLIRISVRQDIRLLFP